MSIAIETSTRNHAVVTTQRAAGYIAPSWRAIRTLAQSKGAFTVIDIMSEAKLTGDLSFNVGAWLRMLVKANYLERVHRGRFRLASDSDTPPALSLSGHPYPLGGKLTVVLPRNEDGVWIAIRELGRTGGDISIDDIGRRILGAVPRAVVVEYLRRLTKAGYLKSEGSARDPRWSLMRAPAETPRLASDGTPMRHAACQDAIWTALQMLSSGYVPIREIAHYASTEARIVSPGDALDYVGHLVLSGHVLAVTRPGAEAIYRLHRYTGPMAPRVMSAHFVWDPNRRCVCGDGQRVREVRR